jgi:hypothetical protein
MTRVLAVLLPVGFIAAVSARNPIPTPLLTPVEAEALQQGAALGAAQRLTGQALVAQVQLYASGTPISRLTLEIHPEAPFTAPDILAYWHPTAKQALNALARRSTPTPRPRP